MSITQKRLDSDGLWLSRQLEVIESEVFDKEYPEFTYARLLPIDFSGVGPAADKYTWRMKDRTGKFKVIQDRDTAIPRMDQTRKEVSQKIITIAGSYGYTHGEVMAARYEGVDLDRDGIEACYRAYEEKVQDVAYFGDTNYGLEGFFNNSSVDVLNVTDSWISNGSTADEMLRLLNTVVAYMVIGTNQVEIPDTLAIAPEDFKILNETARSSTSDTTVLEYFTRNDRYINSIVPVNELAGLAGVGKNRMVAFRRDSRKVELKIPQVLDFMPVQQVQMNYEVISHARVTGTTIRWPKSVLYVNEV